MAPAGSLRARRIGPAEQPRRTLRGFAD